MADREDFQLDECDKSGPLVQIRAKPAWRGLTLKPNAVRSRAFVMTQWGCEMAIVH